MRIYFLRHGRALPRTEWKGDDAERPLSAEGAEAMEREGQAIARLDLAPDAIITSPLARAERTAEIVATHLDMRGRLARDERLAPGFGAKQLAEIVRENPEATALMLVGHEPDFSTIISALIGGGDVACRKGGLARVDLTESSAKRGQLVWLIPPSALTL